MTTLKRIHPVSAGKVLGTVYALLGVIIGVLISLVVLISNNHYSVLLSIGAIILVPIFYGILGFIFGIILAAIYNLTTKWSGGLKIETADEN